MKTDLEIETTSQASTKKPPYVNIKLLKRVLKGNLQGNKAPILTRDRASTILPIFVGRTICVYNGKTYVPVIINDLMIGRKLGEYSKTRTFGGHKEKVQKMAPKAKPKK